MPISLAGLAWKCADAILKCGDAILVLRKSRKSGEIRAKSGDAKIRGRHTHLRKCGNAILVLGRNAGTPYSF
jgi:hypothetical protein